jgi:hypothetical protein
MSRTPGSVPRASSTPRTRSRCALQACQPAQFAARIAATRSESSARNDSAPESISSDTSPRTAAAYFFKTGPLAWQGIFAFWLGLLMYTIWAFIMFVTVRRAIRTDDE